MVAAALVTLGPVRAAAADPVVVNQGFISVETDGRTYYVFGNAHLGIQSTSNTLPWARLGFHMNCGPQSPCAPGSVMNIDNATTGPVALGTAFAYANGVNYGVVDLSGEWRFTSDGLRLPPDVDAAPFPHPQAPFRFTGSIVASLNGETLFSSGLSGSGTASMFMTAGAGGYHWDDATALRYKFTDAETPEPASLLLLGTGALGLALRRRGK